ncbi:MAG: hypothetical protein KDC67_06185, partial [Ignavibacteriae bacterium]|nr:hypothetical protein [Ignavibacteriota bacterium]
MSPDLKKQQKLTMMMNYNKLTKNNWRLLLFITIFYFNSGLVFSQNNLKSEQRKNSNQKANNSKQRVFITGTTDDPKAFNYFNVLNYSYLFASNHKETTKKVINDCLYLRLDSLKSPSIMRIFAFGETTRYNLQVYVTPGDSISFEIKNKDIFFKGKNAAHYNFFKEMKTLDLVRPYFYGDLDEYKKKCKIYFNRQNDFLKNYINKHKEVSINFIEKVKAEIKFNYLKDLMFLNRENQENNLTAIEVLSNRLNIKNQNTFEIVNYFDHITLNEFNHPELLDINSFKICFINYLRYYFINNRFKNYTHHKFMEEKKFILTNLNGDLKDFAVMMLINDYSKNLSDTNIDDLILLTKEYKYNFTNPLYYETINKI